MEEDDLLKGWKKTQPKKIHTFKPVALPYFQNGADSHPGVAGHPRNRGEAGYG
jgi:hypothetical protein